jgi:hypothetical protein
LVASRSATLNALSFNANGAADVEREAATGSAVGLAIEIAAVAVVRVP